MLGGSFGAKWVGAIEVGLFLEMNMRDVGLCLKNIYDANVCFERLHLEKSV